MKTKKRSGRWRGGKRQVSCYQLDQKMKGRRKKIGLTSNSFREG